MLSKKLFLLIILAICASVAVDTLAEAESWDLAYDEAIDLLLRGKNPALAEKQLLIALKQQPNDQQNKRLSYGNRRVNYYPNYFLGIAYFEQKKWKEAAVQFDKVIKSGIFEERDAKYVSALSNYKIALELASNVAKDNAKIEERLGEIKNLLQTQQLSQAENEIELLKKVDPENKEIEGLEKQLNEYQGEKFLEQALESFQRGEHEQAQRVLDLARGKHPTHQGISELSKKLSQARENSNRVSRSQQLISEASDRLSAHIKNREISDTYFSEIRNKVAEAEGLGIDDNVVNELSTKLTAAEKEYGSFLLREAQTAVANKQYALAEELSLKMIRMKLDTSGAKKVLTQIDTSREDIDVAIPPQSDPTPIASPALVKQEVDEEVDEEFDAALLNLLKGNYREAIMEFTALERKKPSAEIHFYFGCALAGFAFMNGKEGEYWLERAKVQFFKMRTLDNTFKPYVKYISPRIVQFYKEIASS